LIHLGLLLQDASFEIRKEVGDKLRSALQAFKLPIRFFSLLFLTAHEVERALADAVDSFFSFSFSFSFFSSWD